MRLNFATQKCIKYFYFILFFEELPKSGKRYKCTLDIL